MPTRFIVNQATNASSVTPSDSVDIAGSTVETPATLYIGTGGNIKVDTIGGDTVTYSNVIGGAFLPIQVKRVYATGTTATDIIANF